MKLTTTMFVLASVAAAALPAAGSIIGTTGGATQIVAPFSAMPGALTASNAWAWNEATNISLGSMPVDLSINPSNSFGPTPGFISGLVDSHFIHYDGTPGTLTFGTVTFSQPILAVQYTDTNLDLTDGLATLGTIYPTTLPGRGFFNWTGADFIDINGNVLTFHMVGAGAPDLEQVRVFTRAVPAPGSVALLGLGGLLAARRRRGC